MAAMTRRTFLSSLTGAAAVGALGTGVGRRSNAGATQRPALKLHVERKERLRGTPHGDCMRGYLLTELPRGRPEVACYVLELPPEGNAPYVSAIPAGTYPVTIRKDGTRGWRLELQHVPSRPNVQIHIGNYPRDTLGCLLPGRMASANDCAVLDSSGAMQALRELFEVFGQEYVTTLSIRDA